MRFVQISSLSLFLLLCTINFKPTSSACLLVENYIIRNLNDGLVLDTSDGIVTVQFFTGFNAELFRFECAGKPGVFNILSRDPLNYALDIDTTDTNNRVFLNNKRDSESVTQQWSVNSDGSIYNVGRQLCLDADESTAGSSLHLTDCGETDLWTLQGK